MNLYECSDRGERYIVCEDCECLIPASEAAPDRLCFPCYAERLIDDSRDSTVRGYLSRSYSDFLCYLKERAYEL